MISKPSTARLRRVLKKTLAAVSGLLVLVLIIAGLALALLPRAASSDWARQSLAGQLEKTLGQPVQIGNIDWSWTEGITISDFAISDRPAFSDGRFLEVSRAHLSIEYSRILNRCLSFSLALENPEMHLIRDDKGRLNLPAPSPAAPGKPQEKAAQEPNHEPFTLPIDIQTD